MNGVKLSTSKEGEIDVEFSREFIKGVSKEIADKVAEEVYYEGLFLKYLPEIKAVEEGKIKVKRGKEAIRFLENLQK